MGKYVAGVSGRPDGYYAVVKEKESGKIVFEQKCLTEQAALSLANEVLEEYKSKEN